MHSLSHSQNLSWNPSTFMRVYVNKGSKLFDESAATDPQLVIGTLVSMMVAKNHRRAISTVIKFILVVVIYTTTSIS